MHLQKMSLYKKGQYYFLKNAYTVIEPVQKGTILLPVVDKRCNKFHEDNEYIQLAAIFLSFIEIIAKSVSCKPPRK